MMLCATMTFVVVRSRLWDMLPSWLQTVLQYRLVKFALAGLPVTGLGLGLYYFEVSHLDANKYEVRPVNWVVLTSLSFAVNWLIWHERQSSKRSAGMRFYAVGLVCAICSFTLFLQLTAGWKVQYLLAQIITGLVVGLPHYVVVDRGVFQRLKIVPVGP